MTLEDMVHASLNMQKERRRYAILQAAAVLYANRQHENSNMQPFIETAEVLLQKIEERDK